MKQGIIPWHRPWTGVADGAINYVTRKPYSLLNQMLLGRDGEWLTFKQIKERGGSIKKGASAGMVVFYTKFAYKKETRKDDGTIVAEEKEIPVLRYYNVFHITDCVGSFKGRKGRTLHHGRNKRLKGNGEVYHLPTI
jgi:antirestriction protein ArdC